MVRERERKRAEVLTVAGTGSGWRPLSREWRDLCSNIEDEFEQYKHKLCSYRVLGYKLSRLP